MRTLFLVAFFTCTSLVSFAQDRGLVKKIVTSEKGLALISVKKSIALNNQNIQNNLAGIYRYKNSKIKKALAFTTKRDRPKLA
jgi:hypothetical protein